MKKLFLLFLLSVLVACGKKEPIEVSKFSGEIVLDESGDAQFEERWEISSNSSADFFKPMDVGALYDVSIKSGDVEFSKSDNWNSENRSGRFHIMPKEGVVWRIEEGKHEYVLRYKIRVFALQMGSEQRIFWQFISKNTVHLPNKAKIFLKGPIKKEDTQVRVSGMDGKVYVKDGEVEIEGKNPDFITINLTIDGTSFKNARAVKAATSETSGEEASKGVVSGSVKSSSSSHSNVQVKPPESKKSYSSGGKISYTGLIVIVLVIALPLGSSALKKRWNKIKNERIAAYFKSLEELRAEVRLETESEAPIDSFYYAYAFLKSFRIADFDVLTLIYVVLDMMKAGICSVEAGALVLLESENEAKIRTEWKPIWQIMKLCEREGGKILPQDFEKTVKKQKHLIKNFYRTIRDRSLEFLFQEGYASDLSNVENSTDARALKDIGMIYTDEGKKIARSFVRYYNFLYNFCEQSFSSNYKVKLWQDKDFKEPNLRLWDNHMTYAVVLGLQSRVSREMNKAFEDYDRETSFSQTAFRYLTSLIRRAVKQYR